MKKLSLGLTDTREAKAEANVQFSSVSRKDIAIIGASGTFAGADDLEQFWQLLEQGADLIGRFPDSRRQDTDPAKGRFLKNPKLDYAQGSYLDRVDQFDCQLFTLTPTEASAMDPNQRLFLEAAWSAIEDAGYGGTKLRGSKTGVYLGYSSDFVSDYKTYAIDQNPGVSEMAVLGSIKSIIASRIAYLLDLKGPSLLVDTACSSSLVAVHLACRALRSGECDMAVAGSVKLLLFPFKDDDLKGITSSDDRTRTFDDQSDGTGLGEGTAAVVLKPLQLALRDNDHIYAVIKGSAINQDGHSIGITAPNSAAQADLLADAWKDAQVDPETISYIEAHGTGTKLGDPVEIGGISKAFARFTRKKQFCAVGSVKANIGHLDHAAGIAGLVKVMYALKHKQLPPLLHFRRPNRAIGFEDSPVYINATSAPWATDGTPRRCGINSFGLAGTNCHVVLEEAPEPALRPRSSASADQLFVLSAQTRDSLLRQVERYRDELRRRADWQLEDVCYTAATGRGHYKYRFAALVRGTEELLASLDRLLGGDMNEQLARRDDEIARLGAFIIVSEQQKRRGRVQPDEHLLTEQEQLALTEQAGSYIAAAAGPGLSESLSSLQALYVQGADIDWEKLYSGRGARKLSLPVYAFQRKRCWVEPVAKAESGEGAAAQSQSTRNVPGSTPDKPRLLPEAAAYTGASIGSLIDRLAAEAPDTEVYETVFRPERQWELGEHKVVDRYVVVGTTYLEMIRQIAAAKHPGGELAAEWRDIVFLAPVAVSEGQGIRVTTTVRAANGGYEFHIASKQADGTWLRHVEGSFRFTEERDFGTFALDMFKAAAIREEAVDQHVEGPIQTGPHWDNIRHVYVGEDEVLVRLELNASCQDDISHYGVHPALFDNAANIAMTLQNDLFLPFRYKIIKLRGAMPSVFYSHVKLRKGAKANNETVTCDIRFVDEAGRVFAEIGQYTIKRVHQAETEAQEGAVKAVRSGDGGEASAVMPEANASASSAWLPVFYRKGWTSVSSSETHADDTACSALEGPVLLLHTGRVRERELAELLRSEGCALIEAILGAAGDSHDGRRLAAEPTEAGMRKLAVDVLARGVRNIIHASLPGAEAAASLDGHDRELVNGAEAVFQLAKACALGKVPSLQWTLVADYAAAVSGDEPAVHAAHAAAFGVGRVIPQELRSYPCRLVDVDEATPLSRIAADLAQGSGTEEIAYRRSQRYMPQLQSVSADRAGDTGTQGARTVVSSGLYVITGGTGGLGLEVARWLAGQRAITLVLVSRTPLPPRSGWDEALAAGPDKLRRAILAVREIEAQGSVVISAASGLADAAALQAQLQPLREQYGPIRGVVHCAGVAGEGRLLGKPFAAFQAVLAPKTRGARVLLEVTRQDSPDFVWLFSSISALLGGLGQTDYTAANAYLDTLASDERRRGFPVQAVNWPAWRETGMAVDYKVAMDEALFVPVRTAEALNALEEIHRRNLSGVIPGEFNYRLVAGLGDALEYGMSPDIAARLEAAKAALRGEAPSIQVLRTGEAPSIQVLHAGEAAQPGEAKPQRNVALAYDAQLDGGQPPAKPSATWFAGQPDTGRMPANAPGVAAETGAAPDIDLQGREAFAERLERQLSGLWARVLGLEEIGPFDNFHSVGGDSILAVRLHKELTAVYGDAMDITDIFSYPSVGEMADYLALRLDDPAEQAVSSATEGPRPFGNSGMAAPEAQRSLNHNGMDENEGYRSLGDIGLAVPQAQSSIGGTGIAASTAPISKSLQAETEALAGNSLSLSNKKDVLDELLEKLASGEIGIDDMEKMGL